MSTTSGKYVVYADDDLDDHYLVSDLFTKIHPDLRLIAFETGAELVEFFQRQDEDSDLPRLIILDVNMPIWDGLQTLREVKKLERLQNVPVLMFTTALNLPDRDQALSLGAAGYVLKPTSYTELSVIIESFSSYFSS
jgi:CheY-like chemotaxis protein